FAYCHLLLLVCLATVICCQPALALKSDEGPSEDHFLGGKSSFTWFFQSVTNRPTQRTATGSMEYPQGIIRYKEHGETHPDLLGPLIPGKVWPVPAPPQNPIVDELPHAYLALGDTTLHWSDPKIGLYNLSPSVCASVMGLFDQVMSENI